MGVALLAVSSSVAFGATPALASSNVAATQAYVQANYAALRVVISHLAASEAAAPNIVARVKGECPGAGAGSPQDPESTQMSDDVIGAIVIGAAQPDLQAIRTAIRATAGLSWSDAGLTREIHAYANDWKTMLSLPDPNLCSDVKGWAANGYHTLPANIVSFVERFMPSWVGAGFLPPKLSRYESASVRALAKRSMGLEQQVAEAEARAVEHWGEIMDTLDLWP